uniref:Uncharacterized protein n=1 Tax=Vitis vinifera TaxID=29760 RepID=A5B6Q0_VITVI|nr:hypothetical protein VITISV_008129 [Vitis vinifera]
MVMAVKLFEAEKNIFDVKFEGFHGVKWTSVTERFRGAVFLVAFEGDEIAWLRKQLKRASELECSLGFIQKYRGEKQGHIFWRFVSTVEEVGQSDQVNTEEPMGDGSCKVKCSYVRVVEEEGPRRRALIPVEKWASTMICESRIGSLSERLLPES